MTNTQAARPSRKMPTPTRRPGRLVVAAAVADAAGTARQGGLLLSDRPFRRIPSCGGLIVAVTAADCLLGAQTAVDLRAVLHSHKVTLMRNFK